MSRLPDPTNSLDKSGKELLEKLSKKRGHIDGMYRTMLHNPDLTAKVSDLGEYLRYGGKLPGDIREVTILYIAQELKAEYEWVKHEPCAKAEHVPEKVIEAIKENKELPAEYKKYQDIISVAKNVLERKNIPEALQSEVEKNIGTQGIVELVVLTGFYYMIAGVIFSFDVPLPEGAINPFN